MFKTFLLVSLMVPTYNAAANTSSTKVKLTPMTPLYCGVKEQGQGFKSERFEVKSLDNLGKVDGCPSAIKVNTKDIALTAWILNSFNDGKVCFYSAPEESKQGTNYIFNCNYNK